MENPSIPVSGHGSSMNRTFIVDDCSEDDIGHWATDEVTGEQGYIDDEKSCFWTWDDIEYAWQSRPFNGRRVRRRKGKCKGKGKGRSERTEEKVDSKEKEEHSLVENKHRTLNGTHTAWMASAPLNLANHPKHVVLDLGSTRSIGSRTALRMFQKDALYHGILAISPFVSANSETEACWESLSS